MNFKDLQSIGFIHFYDCIDNNDDFAEIPANTSDASSNNFVEWTTARCKNQGLIHTISLVCVDDEIRRAKLARVSQVMNTWIDDGFYVGKFTVFPFWISLSSKSGMEEYYPYRIAAFENEEYAMELALNF